MSACVFFIAHSNVKLFITHGGLHSIEEAVYNGKPVIGIPFFADQLSNMRVVEKNGYGKLITYNELTEESFGNAVEEVITNTTYVYSIIIVIMCYKVYV